ncbi:MULTISPECIES: hypothetical protein [Streptomyces]|uniref:hypothetical protein n=1 Tax=Streptomyces TaxID=1883 RepID=UPI0033DFEB08
MSRDRVRSGEIESPFSTVKLRTKVTRGVGSPAAALAMVFKLVDGDAAVDRSGMSLP